MREWLRRNLIASVIYVDCFVTTILVGALFIFQDIEIARSWRHSNPLVQFAISIVAIGAVWGLVFGGLRSVRQMTGSVSERARK